MEWETCVVHRSPGERNFGKDRFREAGATFVDQYEVDAVSESVTETIQEAQAGKAAAKGYDPWFIHNFLPVYVPTPTGGRAVSVMSA